MPKEGVPFQSRPPRRTVPAPITFVRFLARVRLHMPVQGTALHKRRITQATREWSLAQMRPNVLDQGMFVDCREHTAVTVEPLLALGRFGARHERARDAVAHQMVHVCVPEGLAAVDARFAYVLVFGDGLVLTFVYRGLY